MKNKILKVKIMLILLIMLLFFLCYKALFADKIDLKSTSYLLLSILDLGIISNVYFAG